MADEIYEVIAQGLNLRAAPSDGAVLSVLPKGQVVEKLSESNEKPGWWKVHTTVGKLEEEGFFSNLKASLKRLTDFVGPYASRFTTDMLPSLNQVLTQYEINKNTKRFTHF